MKSPPVWALIALIGVTLGILTFSVINIAIYGGLFLIIGLLVRKLFKGGGR